MEDPGALAQLMRRAFECRILEDSRSHVDVTLGPSLVRVHRSALGERSARGPNALSYVALCAADVSSVLERVRSAGLSLTESGDVAKSWCLSEGDWGGVPLWLIEGQPPTIAGEPGGGVVLGIDHLGVASRDNAWVRRRFSGLLDIPVESEQTDTEATLRVEQFTSDTYGVRVVSREVKEPSGLRVLFLSIGDTDFEFLQDLASEHATSAGAALGGGRSTSTSGDRSAIARYVDRHGPGLHHVAIRVSDIDAALKRAENAGVELINSAGRPGSRRAEIAFMHPASTSGILFHFVQREPA